MHGQPRRHSAEGDSLPDSPPPKRSVAKAFFQIGSPVSENFAWRGVVVAHVPQENNAAFNKKWKSLGSRDILSGVVYRQNHALCGVLAAGKRQFGLTDVY